jgi:hypothetical protein
MKLYIDYILKNSSFFVDYHYYKDNLQETNLFVTFLIRLISQVYFLNQMQIIKKMITNKILGHKRYNIIIKFIPLILQIQY